MPAEVTIPRLGWSMEEGIFVRWLKRDGEWVKKGDQLFLLESEKATQEIESFDEGVLRIPPAAPRPGDTVQVGQVIGFLMAAGESSPVEGAASPAVAPAQAPQSAAGPAVRRLARQLNVALDDVAGSGPGGRVTAADVHAEAARSSQERPAVAARANENRGADGAAQRAPLPAQSSPRAVNRAITPRARRVARELGVDPNRVNGSGRGGRIREQDIRATAAQPEIERTADTTVKADSIRRTIARRMVASHTQTAPVTLTTRVDATNLLNLRGQFKAAAELQRDVVPSITDLAVKLVAIALARHPRLNARWEEQQIVELSDINIGIAVDSVVGLVVPVLRDVRHLGVRQIATRARELIEKAGRGTLSLSELQGGTFTVTNLGMYGIDAFTPIINAPETAILGVGAIRREPVFADSGAIVPRDLVTLSLTFDHRVVDGAPAARFLETLRVCIENPAAWLSE